MGKNVRGENFHVSYLTLAFVNELIRMRYHRRGFAYSSKCMCFCVFHLCFHLLQSLLIFS